MKGVRKRSRQTSRLDKINSALELLKEISDNIPGVIQEVKALFGPRALPPASGSTTPNMSPLETLGLPPNASVKQIKAKYRELARQYHPDTTQAGGEMMKVINSAYEELKREKGFS